MNTTNTSLPAEATIAQVRLEIADLDRSLDFYGGLLDMRADRDGDAAVLSSAAGGPAFIELRARPGTRPRPEGVIGLYHFAILYPDRAALARTIGALIDNRWQFTGFADHGVSEAAYLQDPDGLGVELYVDRPRAFWPRDASGRLVMYTRAPDLDALLAERGGDGGPERIGHIHLHVADLDRSTRFHHDVIGFDIVQDSLPGAVFLSAGGYHHHVGLNTWARGRTTDPDRAGLLAWTLRIPAGEPAAALRARLAGAEASDLGEDAYRDPDGNVMIVESGS
jgi:catechol 2,3-dioxygenase